MNDPQPQKRTAAMGFIMAAVLIDMISIGLIVPVLPHIVGLFTQSNDEQTSGFLMLTLAFGVANFFGSPVLGALSDRYGRRPVLLIGFAGLALSFFVTALAPALWVLVVVRLFSGAMQANISIANAYVADITAPQDRAKRFGQLGAMFGLGFMLGPVIGGLLGDHNVRLPFYAAGTLAIVNWCYGFFVLPESLPPEKRRPIEPRKMNPVAALQGLAALKGVGPLVFVLALSSLAQFMLHTSWVLYTKFKFGWGPAQVGWSLLAVGIVSVLSQGVLLRPLLKRFSPQKLAIAGMTSGALAYLGFGLASEGWMMYIVICANLL
ncbi:MAG TPA: MFS transporter, partial [Roseateles sp.]